MADGVRTLPPMAPRRPLAADNGSAQALPMMQTAHSRDRSGTVGLGQGRLHRSGGLVPHAGQDVRVAVQRKGYGSVAKKLLD